MRPLFTDGWNSATHVGLGLLRNPGVAAVFVAYHLAEGGENTPRSQYPPTTRPDATRHLGL